MEEKAIALFLADFDHQASLIEEIYSTLESRFSDLTRDGVEAKAVESSGYWLHNLYCAYEDLFKVVAAFWENNFDFDGAFHKALLRRMLLEIQGVRPELLSENAFRHLNELRSFRHVFRHAYSYGLDEDRVRYLTEKVLKKKGEVLADLARFRQKIVDALGA